MLLLHGLRHRWQAFLPLIPFLVQSWQVFALDFRGHGKSGHVHQAYRGEDYSADIARFIEKKIGSSPVIFGHSLGGMVALYFASHCPTMTRALLLGDVPIHAESLQESAYPELFRVVRDLLLQRASLQQLTTLLGEIEVNVPSVGRQRLQDLPGNDQAALRWWATSLLMLDPEALTMSVDGRAIEHWLGPLLLPKITCPTLMMQADREFGGLMSERDVDEALGKMAQPVHVRLKGVGHPLFLQKLEPVLRPVLQFLSAL